MTLRDLPISSREEVSEKETENRADIASQNSIFLRSLLPFSVRKWGTNCQNGTQCKYPSRPGFAMSSPCIQKKWIGRQTKRPRD
jgi:hypothetical protein